jgi:homoserine O-acetyltransferase
VQNDPSCSLTLPSKNYEEQVSTVPMDEAVGMKGPSGPPQDLVDGMMVLRSHPVLVLGVVSDILFPAWQQQEIADTLRATGNRQVTHIELGEDLSLFGHDTFLLDLENVGGSVGKFLQ